MEKNLNKDLNHWIILPYTWNQHSIVNQLYFNLKKLKLK